MARGKYGNSFTKNTKWIKEGRGKGHGSEYKPWLTVRDLPSEGRVHRIFGHKSQRTHHLLSDLELAVFFLLEWNEKVTDIREQFPLQIDSTKNIALNAGISHPKFRSVFQYLSSDFLVSINDSNTPCFALQAKYADDLNEPRTIEKLELERRYWKEKEIAWYLVTEKNIPKEMTNNIKWLYPAQRDVLDKEKIIEWMQFYSYHFHKNGDKKLIEVCKKLDVAYKLDDGQSLLEVRQLLAKRCFYFDMNKPAHLLRCKDLIVENTINLMDALYVSNQ